MSSAVKHVQVSFVNAHVAAPESFVAIGVYYVGVLQKLGVISVDLGLNLRVSRPTRAVICTHVNIYILTISLSKSTSLFLKLEAKLIENKF